MSNCSPLSQTISAAVLLELKWQLVVNIHAIHFLFKSDGRMHVESIQLIFELRNKITPLFSFYMWNLKLKGGCCEIMDLIMVEKSIFGFALEGYV